MRFYFRGLTRDTGKPLEGHVEAAHSEEAYNVLSQNGIVTELLREDPKPLNLSPNQSVIPEFTEALDSALDSSSSQVPFDALTERYRGKNVWVIDRDKIKQRVAQVVDSTLAASESDLDSGITARQRVANAISGLFHDNRNIASEHNADSIAGMRAMSALNRLAPNNPGNMSAGALAQQIGRLTDVVQQAEGMIAAMAVALRNVEAGAGRGGPIRHRIAAAPSFPPEQNSVLREIFESNLQLRREIAKPATQPFLRPTGTE